MFDRYDILAIDPLALILSPEVYVRLHLPDPPPLDFIASRVKDAVSLMKAEDKKRALIAVKTLGAYARAMEKALAEGM